MAMTTVAISYLGLDSLVQHTWTIDGGKTSVGSRGDGRGLPRAGFADLDDLFRYEM